MIKLSLSLFLCAFLWNQTQALAAIQERAILIQNVNIMEWPENLSADAALDIFIELMQADPQARSLLEKSNQKLNHHGIEKLSDIFDYCTEPKATDTVQALFSQQSRILEARVSIPGIEVSNWAANTLETQKTAFSSKIVKTPFLEFYLMSEAPTICIYKGKKIFQAYNSIIHELIHFLLLDPFSQLEGLLNPQLISNHLDNIINRSGGEYDAFKIANSVEKRFLKKYSLENYSTDTLVYFNSDGVLIDESGLKKHITKSYSVLFEGVEVTEKIQKSKNDFIQYKLDLLKNNVQPYLDYLAKPELLKELEAEVSTLENTLI